MQAAVLSNSHRSLRWVIDKPCDTSDGLVLHTSTTISANYCCILRIDRGCSCHSFSPYTRNNPYLTTLPYSLQYFEVYLNFPTIG